MIVCCCCICGEEFESNLKLSVHIRYTYYISVKEYYDQYLKKEDEGICPVCGKETKFLKISKGYRKTCSKLCHNRYNLEMIKNNCLEKYGVENPFAVEEFKGELPLP